MLNEIQIAQLKQLKDSINKLLDANDDVYYRCGDYSIYDQEV